MTRILLCRLIPFTTLISLCSLASPARAKDLPQYQKETIRFSVEQVDCEVGLSTWPSGIMQFNIDKQTYYADDDAAQCYPSLLDELAIGPVNANKYSWTLAEKGMQCQAIVWTSSDGAKFAFVMGAPRDPQKPFSQLSNYRETPCTLSFPQSESIPEDVAASPISKF